MREPGETLEGSQILGEHPGDLGVLLWNALRDVTLWASVEPERREGLFTPEAGHRRLEELREGPVDPGVEVALTTLAAVSGNPDTVSTEIVTLVCIEISRWANERGAYETAIAFAQAAALASPEDAAPAYRMGSLALSCGRHARAETWLRRSIGLARRSKDWQSYAQAYVDMGTLYARRDLHASARRFYTQAVRAGRRHGLLAVRGAALHGLFLLAMDTGELDDAQRLATSAMRAYGKGHQRLAELRHDVAQFHVVRGEYGRALPLLQKLLVIRHATQDRAFTLALIAHAAGGTGERGLYEESWRKAWSLLDLLARDAGTPRTLLELARAAALRMDWLRVSLATQRPDAQAAIARSPRLADEVAQLAALAESRRGG